MRFSKPLVAALALVPAFALGQTRELIGGDVQKRANGVLAMMGYMLTPDVTTGSLAISNDASGNPDFGMSTLGGGFTVSKETPLYLEGTLGHARYDPTFTSTDGVTQGTVASHWDAYSISGGIGWGFPIARNLALRPVFNLSYGHVESNVTGSGQSGTGSEFSFLHNGKLNAYGIGGSLMLDYERYRPENDIDVELRYTHIYMHSFGGSSTVVQGQVLAQSLSLWSRWRAPTGTTMFERPLRYVLEFAHTTYIGDLDGTLGFNYLSSFGTGLELSAINQNLFTRARLMARYQLGEHVRGWSLGLAADF